MSATDGDEREDVALDATELLYKLAQHSKQVADLQVRLLLWAVDSEEDFRALLVDVATLDSAISEIKAMIVRERDNRRRDDV